MPRCSSIAWTIWYLGSQAHAFICHLFPSSSSKSKSHEVLREADVCPHLDANRGAHGSRALPAPLPVSISTLGPCRMGFHKAGFTPSLTHLCPNSETEALVWTSSTWEVEQEAAEGNPSSYSHSTGRGTGVVKHQL